MRAHLSNSSRTDMLLLSNTLSWIRANQYLLFLLNAACLAEKQQIPILYSLVWPDRDSNPRSTALEEHANHYTSDAVTSFDKKEIVTNHKSFMSSGNSPIIDEHNDLSTLYRIPNLQRNSYRWRYIAGSYTYSTTKIPSINRTKMLSAVKEGLQSYCGKVYTCNNTNQTWIL